MRKKRICAEFNQADRKGKEKGIEDPGRLANNACGAHDNQMPGLENIVGCLSTLGVMLTKRLSTNGSFVAQKTGCGAMNKLGCAV